jgi:predicted permease
VGQNKSRATLVVVEIALSAVLLTAAGLQMRSFAAVLNQSPGIDPEGLVVGQVWVPVPNNPAANPYLTGQARVTLMRGLLDQLAQMPGVQSASLGSTADVPFLNSTTRTFPFSLPDDPATQEGNRASQFGTVSPTYFETIGTAVKQGRVFTDHDDPQSQLVVVVNEAFVRAFAPKGDLVGHRLRLGRNVDFQIVGVVADVHNNGLDVPAPPHIYTSILQRPTITLAIFVRTKQGTQQMEAAMNTLVHKVDPELPVFGVRTMDDLMSQSMSRRQFSLYLIAAFGVAALLLAVLGIYGVMSLVVNQRRPEFAVRLARGARPRDILALAVGPGISLAGIGTAIGLIVSLGVASSMAALVYGVSARDPVTFVVVAMVLPIAAAVACLVPAARAMRVPLLDVLKR